METSQTWQQKWINTPEWEVAKKVHSLLCRRTHDMEGCWGLNDGYYLKQKEMPFDFRNWLSRALGVIWMCGSVDAAMEFLGSSLKDPREEHPLFGPWTVPTTIE